MADMVHLTRRELAATLLAGAAAAQQTPAPPVEPERGAADELTKDLDAIRKLRLSYEAEPAFAFRAI